MFTTVLCGWAFTLGSTNQIQGRFFFPYSGIIALILSSGIVGLAGSRKALASISLCLILANSMCLWQLWKRYQPTDDQGDLVLDAHQCSSDRVVLKTLSDGWEHGQSLWCKYPNLVAIDVMFAGKGRGDALIEMEVADVASGHVFRTANHRVKDIKPDGRTRFSFEPIGKSERRRLMIRFRLSSPTSEGDFSLRYALGNPYLDGVRYLNRVPCDGDLRFAAWCRATDGREDMR
jgi:hypothetical protein